MYTNNKWICVTKLSQEEKAKIDGTRQPVQKKKKKVLTSLQVLVRLLE